jgi:hypothetical protein
MFIVDSLLVGGLRFVLDKISAAVDRELNDVEVLRQQLLEAEMRLELGEIDEAEFAEVERDLLDRIRAQRLQADGLDSGAYRVTGAEATVVGDEPVD